MFSFISGMTGHHDTGFILLAATTCLLSSLTTASLLGRALDAQGRPMHAWIGATAFVAGSGAWATHFLAVLGYTPGTLIAFDIGRTFASAIVAIALSWIAFLIALCHSTSRYGVAAGGAILGLAIATMHYVGISGLDIAAHIVWSRTYIAASVIAAIVFAVPAILLMTGGGSIARRLSGTLFLTGAIIALHFTGMMAMTLTPALHVTLPEGAVRSDWIAAAISAVTASIIVIAIAVSLVDRHLARREKEEATRLRRYVLELEASQYQLRSMSEKLKVALREASAAAEAKTAFLAQTSHELRTPLNAVIGFAELMENETFGPLGHPNYREYASDIRKSGQHLLGIISDLLDLVRTSSGDIELMTEEFDGKELIDDVFRMMNVQARKAGLTLTQTTPSAPVELYGDRKRIKQIAINLLNNAIKFTPRGGSIELRLEEEQDTAVLRVCDTGIGMSPEQIPSALEHFGQIDKEHRRKYDGLGIGLPLSKNLAEMHGGRLEIASTPGKGTVVSVFLPRHMEAAQAEPPDHGPVTARIAS